MILAKFAKTAVRFAGENASPILAGFAVVGVISSVVLAVKAAPKAKDILEDRRDEIEDARDTAESDEDAKKAIREINFRYFKELAPVVGPVVLTTVLTVTCIIGSTAAGLRRQAALAAACNLSETAFDKFYEKTKEVVGEEKVKEIENAVSEDLAKATPAPENVTLGYGEILVLEPTQHRYIAVTKDRLDVLEKEIELELTNYDFYQLSKAYDFLKLPNTDFGDVMGWGTPDGDRRINIYLHPSSTPDDRPCFTMHYSPSPHVI